ncbi:MAG: diacylglycerol kinase family protein [Clostridia bacterium]|nr:diacylglycerol kinase family protein [Clostridia bacterium]
MAKGYVLFNQKAGNGRGKKGIEGLSAHFKEELTFLDMTALEGGYKGLFDKMNAGDFLVLCGGDGTLNCFVNDTAELSFAGDIWYFPTGTGNDFATEMGKKRGDAPFLVSEYLKDLPTVTVNGKDRLFLNGVGYGIDGYCCEVGDAKRAKSDKSVNYTAIAIKGLLLDYKPTSARVTVDGKEYFYKKVWIAPTMKGKCYGGGMIPAPEQKRDDPEKMLSLTLFHTSGRLKTLMIFPSIFKGEHVKNEKYVAVLKGREITVEFDSPRALQIDGETVLDVLSYTAKA